MLPERQLEQRAGRGRAGASYCAAEFGRAVEVSAAVNGQTSGWKVAVAAIDLGAEAVQDRTAGGGGGGGQPEDGAAAGSAAGDGSAVKVPRSIQDQARKGSGAIGAKRRRIALRAEGVEHRQRPACQLKRRAGIGGAPSVGRRAVEVAAAVYDQRPGEIEGVGAIGAAGLRAEAIEERIARAAGVQPEHRAGIEGAAAARGAVQVAGVVHYQAGGWAACIRIAGESIKERKAAAVSFHPVNRAAAHVRGIAASRGAAVGGRAIEVAAAVHDQPAERGSSIGAIGQRAEAIEERVAGAVGLQPEHRARIIGAATARSAVQIAAAVPDQPGARQDAVGATGLRAKAVQRLLVVDGRVDSRMGGRGKGCREPQSQRQKAQWKQIATALRHNHPPVLLFCGF